MFIVELSGNFVRFFEKYYEKIGRKFVDFMILSLL